MAQDFSLTTDIYQRSGTLIIRPENQLAALAELAEERRKEAPEIGQITCLSPAETQQALPLLKPLPALKISGGGRLDGAAYLAFLEERARTNGVVFVQGRLDFIKKKLGRFYYIRRNPSGSCLFNRRTRIRPTVRTLELPRRCSSPKGQLLSFETTASAKDWPVAMLEGEGDLIPLRMGRSF